MQRENVRNAAQLPARTDEALISAAELAESRVPLDTLREIRRRAESARAGEEELRLALGVAAALSSGAREGSSDQVESAAETPSGNP